MSKIDQFSCNCGYIVAKFCEDCSRNKVARGGQNGILVLLNLSFCLTGSFGFIVMHFKVRLICSLYGGYIMAKFCED